jgi:AcrR family transcriptional regulator
MTGVATSHEQAGPPMAPRPRAQKIPQTDAAAPTRRARRSHAERSEETQRRAVAAAIACLHRVGFASTTTSQVADEAGISRGAMLHQYPTRADLMLAVVRRVYDEERELYRAAFDAVEGRLSDKMLAIPEITWRILSRPEALAVLEILIEGRSDPTLAGPLAELQAQIETEAKDGMLRRFPSKGFAELPERAALHRVFVAAIRGLSIDSLRPGQTEEIQQSVQLLRRFMELWIEDQRRKRT